MGGHIFPEKIVKPMSEERHEIAVIVLIQVIISKVTAVKTISFVNFGGLLLYYEMFKMFIISLQSPFGVQP